MAGFLGLFGGSPNDYYTGNKWMSDYGNKVNYNPTAYNKFDPSSYAGGMGSAYESAVKTQLSGQLSPAVIAMLQKQFQSNLASAKAGSYGAPVGAQGYNQMQVASDNALQAALLGENQIQAGENAAIPYLGIGERENQFSANFGENQNEFSSNLALAKARYAGGLDEEAYKNANQDQGIFGDILSAATTWGLGKIFPKQQNFDPYNIAGVAYGG